MLAYAAAVFWSPFRIYNPLLAFFLALFFALAIRFFLLSVFGRRRSGFVILFRLFVGLMFLVLAWSYFLFAAPLIEWDLSERAVAAITLASVGLWVVIRNIKGGTDKSPRCAAKVCYVGLFIVLVFVATLTIIRTGYIALTGDRVTLLLSVTGESRNQTVNWSTPGGPASEKQLTAHHVIFWLPTGIAAADMWISGDEVAVKGKAIRVSPALRFIGIPNFYALEYAHNGYLSEDRKNAFPSEAIPFPGTGSLAVHPWWRPLQNRLLNFWADRGAHGSWWGIQIARDESPYYPLIDNEGKPVHKDFLLVLKPSGVASSRGSSPLEDKQNLNK